jgi:hypothetical protein
MQGRAGPEPGRPTLGTSTSWVKWQIVRPLQFRLEVPAYLTPFPQEIVAPNVGSSVSGVLRNIVPLAAIAYTF